MAKLKSDQENLVATESVELDEPPQLGNTILLKIFSINDLIYLIQKFYLNISETEQEDPIVKAEREFFEIIKQVGFACQTF